MAVEEIIEGTPGIVLELGKIGLWIQAIGLIVILWIIFQGITMYFNRKRRKMIEEIRTKVRSMEKKIDNIDGKLSRKKG